MALAHVAVAALIGFIAGVVVVSAPAWFLRERIRAAMIRHRR